MPEDVRPANNKYGHQYFSRHPVYFNDSKRRRNSTNLESDDNLMTFQIQNDHVAL